MKPSPRHATLAGRLFVAAELTRRGADDVELPRAVSGTHVRATLPEERTVEIVVHTRRRGDWQSRASIGCRRDADPTESRFWVFVDLGRGFAPAAYFLAPEWWVQNDIYLAHQEYLARHGGERACTKDSDHHRLTLDRIAPWHERWDVLGLG